MPYFIYAFEKSRKLPLTLSDGFWSKSNYMLSTVDNIWFIQESLEQNSDWFELRKLLFSGNKNTGLHISCSKVLQQIDKREIRQ